MTKYRKLNRTEIERLTAQECMADDWNQVHVTEGFSPAYIAHTRFSGEVYLGRFEQEIELPGGLRKHAGLRHVTLHNCTIGNNTLIENIPNYVANYQIGDYCYIQNVNLLLTEGESCFGNNTEVSVLNETGGREVPIYNRLSAQLAYIVAMYRHRPDLIGRLRQMIADYARTVKSSRGTIGNGVHIVNTGTIRNVCIGDACRIEGASRLDNGTINSRTEAPVYIGANVTAEDFIISSGACVSDGVVLSRCFIGQACHLTHLFSAHDSLFFSNCQGENGEACAIFAGPYTVTMHKSSLLIAGMFSFLNAGSGSNQSNHMYKLGPIHQGVVERGSKTTSDSYMLWPAKIGAFSLIMGRHVTHPDTSGMPFSYLIEHGNRSYLVPGANLKSVGTIRDAQKWPKRDRRTDPDKLDCINFNLLSPYTIQKMLQGIDTLQGLKQTSGETSECYSFQSTTIKNSSLEKGINLYTLAVHKFMGNSIIKRLEGVPFADLDDLHSRLQPTDPLGEGEWIDLAGLIIPKQAMQEEIERIVHQSDYTLEEAEAFFRTLHRRYYDMEWTWVCSKMQRWYGKSINQLTPQDIIGIVHQWNEAVVSLDHMLYDDARKEFSMISRIGFGVDGSASQRDFDFEQVRGEFESDPFVKMVCRHIEEKTALGDELLGRLNQLIDKTTDE
ncbi:DUF4954 family protein [Barnesiella viscericola]|uniref:DUF4954 family protein n=1 Tax=Barnesiella viscericola TaxID=397865 RepID=A0A921MRB5_9BACT|nr:DUF4954 family protein [Barnesiella viscericola]HJG88977.1 DUF4954 family protein [Barnesiella viscericola]